MKVFPSQKEDFLLPKVEDIQCIELKLDLTSLFSISIATIRLFLFNIIFNFIESSHHIYHARNGISRSLDYHDNNICTQTPSQFRFLIRFSSQWRIEIQQTDGQVQNSFANQIPSSKSVCLTNQTFEKFGRIANLWSHIFHPRISLSLHIESQTSD